MSKSKHLLLGKSGEKLAEDYLRHQHWDILATNWRFSRAEIDIIARKDKLLVFVEVKTRSSNHFGMPEEAVHEQKQLMLAEAAAAYMREIHHEWEFRFDVISILWEKETGRYQLRHLEDAFFPPLG